MKTFHVISISFVTALLTSAICNYIQYKNIPVEDIMSADEQSVYQDEIAIPKSDYKLLTPAQVLSRYNIIDHIEVNIDYQINPQATINIAKQCKHTGTNREKNVITFYIDCDDLPKALHVHDNGTLTNFSIEQHDQEESISITFHKSYGVDFKLNKHFSNINKNTNNLGK